ncbi:MAG TPA: alkaline phosphatase family protein [Pseudonocardiaceae bacterium]|jgi:phospholipase C|nr:alkaline phosphatase family protein [Pseudonocardiaceae bacterium]
MSLPEEDTLIRFTKPRGARWSRGPVAAVALLAAGGLVLAGCAASNQADNLNAANWGLGTTTTPIKHVVVLFDENVSFDHYFGTYPNATNADGTPFKAAPGTPQVTGLTKKLLTNNPNSYNPQRLTSSEALTCDQNHSYAPEQKAYDNGKADQFVQNTSADTCTGQPIDYGAPGLALDYYDGNTVTALWNYAQNYALNDNSFDTQYGPSSPGAINLVSGDTYGTYAVNPTTGQKVVPPPAAVVGSPDSSGIGTMYGDSDPAFDDCSDNNGTATSTEAAMTGQNIGDLLDKKAVTWGWFQGGFAPSSTVNGKPVCGTAHENVGGQNEIDYSPHHNPFEFYASTSNPKHLPPSSDKAIGITDQANHNYDLSVFNTALNEGNLPAVSFLKAGEYQDGHAGYSDPLDEQNFLVNEINAVQHSKDWASTAIVVAYDDSDGWYDQVTAPVVNGSHDSTLDSALCTGSKKTLNNTNDRCGYGPRLPLLVISPYSKKNYVDNTLTDQSSITRFIENNWKLGSVGNGSYDQIAGSLTNMFNFNKRPDATPLTLDSTTGAVIKGK